LRAFTADDEPIYYGRGAETDDLIEAMRASLCWPKWSSMTDSGNMTGQSIGWT
jgi:hypothetical protein